MRVNASVKWHDLHREPRCAPNPDYPNGIDLNVTNGAELSCLVELPYPAKRCGYYEVRCHNCGFSLICTTAGRPDDPRSVRLPCIPKKE
jgi:hypothetical protein